MLVSLHADQRRQQVSIADRFGGKRREPTVPPMPPAQRPLPPSPHEKTAQALAFVTAINEEVVALREENARLRSERDLSLSRCRDLEQERTSLRSDLEAYRRYSVTMRSNLQTIIDVCRRVNDEAVEAGERRVSEQRTERIFAETEREVRELAAGEFAKDKKGCGNE